MKNQNESKAPLVRLPQNDENDKTKLLLCLIYSYIHIKGRCKNATFQDQFIGINKPRICLYHVALCSLLLFDFYPHEVRYI